MNIFCTDDDPFVSAQNLDDKRVNKMIIESAQMLCTALRLHGSEHNGLYKTAFVNHPCSVWARRTRGNFQWLVSHAIGLCYEYTDVYRREHKTQTVILQCLALTDRIPAGELEPFVNCSLDKNVLRPVVDCYRDTMNIKWMNDKIRPTWQGRGHPDWYRNLGGINA